MLPKLSFELFPPKTERGQNKLLDTVGSLLKLQPEFITMTFGTGQSGTSPTLETLLNIQKKYTETALASHLTYLSDQKHGLKTYADKLWDNNIRSIVALRGDIPEGKDPSDYTPPEYYAHTDDFIKDLKTWHDFNIIVGTYPEKHPESKDQQQDIFALKKKQEAGASMAFTQFFFDNNIFYDFCEKAAQQGVTIPIYPGILPIRSFDRMLNFAKNCQTTVPDWLIAGFERYKNNPESQRSYAVDVFTEQVTDLSNNGIQHLHIYCLNDTAMINEALSDLGRSSEAETA